MSLDLRERLRERRAEIEGAIQARVFALEDPTRTGDPAYVEGLRTAVSAALSYALEGMGRSESRPAPIPTALFAQARHAARDGVPLDTVLRRYLAGYTLFGDFLHQEAEQMGILETQAFQRLRRDQAALLDRLIAAVSEEHARESEPWRRSPEQRRAELVRRLLAGELLDTDELGYGLEGWHLGLIAAGEGVEEALRDLARALDRRLLAVPAAKERTWAWLGGSEATQSERVRSLAEERLPKTAALALGEPGQGAGGWRLSHRQACLAWPLADAERAACYRDAPLLAAALHDEVLAASLRSLYLDPLDSARDDGPVLRETLRAYFAAACNVSSTASALAVSRTTVTNRLHRIEERLGRPIGACMGEIDVALRLGQRADFRSDQPKRPARFTLTTPAAR